MSKESQEFISKQDEIAHKIKVKNLALAYLKRGIDAGIPERFLRINQQEFEMLLFNEYYGGKQGAKNFANTIYQNVKSWKDKPFILIDGGSIATRLQAGYAILFRLITCDMFGDCVSTSYLSNKCQTIKSTATENRNDIVEKYKEDDVLFITEFKEHMFKEHFDAGNFVDEILASRSSDLKPTIISFGNAIDASQPIMGRHCGEYFSDFSILEYCNKKDKTFEHNYLDAYLLFHQYVPL